MPEITEAEYWQLVHSRQPLRRSLDELLNKRAESGGLPTLVSRDRVIEPEKVARTPDRGNPLDRLGKVASA